MIINDLIFRTTLQYIKADIKEKIEKGNANDPEKRLNNILAVIKFKYYVMAIVATSIHKLSASLAETSRISFMPSFAKGDTMKVEQLANALKPICNTILPHITHALGEDCYTFYNDTATLETISTDVVTGLASVRAIYSEMDGMINNISTMLCNG